MLLARFAMFVPVTIVGLFFLLHTYGGFRRARQDAEEPEPPAEQRTPPAAPERAEPQRPVAARR